MFSDARRKALINNLVRAGVPSDPAVGVVEILEYIDPTSRGIYGNWLVDEFLNNSFKLDEDQDTVRDTLVFFEEVKGRLPNKDINQYDLHSLRRTITAYEDKISKSNPQKVYLSRLRAGRVHDDDESQLVVDSGRYSVIRVVDLDTAALLATNTSWCVKRCEWAEKYLRYGPLYFVLDDGAPLALYYKVSEKTRSIMYRHDIEDMIDGRFPGMKRHADTKLESVIKDVQSYLGDVGGTVPLEDFRDTTDNDFFDYDSEEHEGLDSVMSEVEKVLESDDFGHGRWYDSDEYVVDEIFSYILTIEADLSGSDLSYLKFTNSQNVIDGGPIDWHKKNLQGANFTGATLENMNMQGVQLAGAKFRKAKMNGITLADADLRGADFYDAELVGAVLTRANLQDTNFVRVDVQYARVDEADFRGANLSGTDLSRAANPDEAIL